MAKYLKHIVNTHDKEGNKVKIEIRCGDPSLDKHNGHSDFAITADITTPRGRWLSGGCQHDVILALKPELKQFVDLHLSDAFLGSPMYAIENGYYHIQQGEKYAQSYIRATDEEFAVISKAADKIHFGYLLVKLGIAARWKEEARAAREKLEELTGETMEDTTTRPPFTPPTEEEVKAMQVKIDSGYYSPEQIKVRYDQCQADKRAELVKEIEAEYSKANGKAMTEYQTKLAALNFGLPINNLIVYTHSNEANFNWKGYDEKITVEQFEAFVKYVSELGNDWGYVKAVKFFFGERKK
jgi:hypothetical protein